jgi:hypothetical protein
MRSRVFKRFVVMLACAAWVTSVGVLAHLALGVEGEQPAATSQDKPAAKSSKQRRRLPPYYARVVDEKQREAIYAIQDEYAPRIEELQKQLDALIAERDAKIEEVLTPEQREQVKQLAAEAQQRRKQRRSEGTPPEENGAGANGTEGANGAAPENPQAPPTPEKDKSKGGKKNAK